MVAKLLEKVLPILPTWESADGAIGRVRFELLKGEDDREKRGAHAIGQWQEYLPC